jgi:hypothetical protein
MLQQETSFSSIDPIDLIFGKQRSSKITRSGVSFEVFRSSGPAAESAQSPRGFFGLDFLVGVRLEELLNAKSSRIPSGSFGRQDMVGSDDLEWRKRGCVMPGTIISFRTAGMAKTRFKKSSLTLSPYETQVFAPKNKAP